MGNKLSGKETIVIGLMLFALFLGAGNMIFPPAMGQQAGQHVWVATLGFLITGVGLPFLGILAIALSGSDIQAIGNRVHPKFAIIFPILLYLIIGPFFGIPRTGTVAYEIGITPFLSDNLENKKIWLLLYTIIFFGSTFLIALNPSKLVDRVGKILTPSLIIIIVLLTIKALITPMGTIEAPTGEYIENAFFTGFFEGYLTMDTLGALVFGIVIITAVKERGIESRQEITKICLKAGIIAATGLIFVYVSLAYIGATSTSSLGYLANGGQVLSGVATTLFGSIGNIGLALAITFACLTTSVGLVSAFGTYFAKFSDKLSYKQIILIVTVFSTCIANVGLSQLISISIPLLITIYPIAIVLIIISFLGNITELKPIVYIISLTATSFFSIFDGLNAAKINMGTTFTEIVTHIPLFNLGLGWLLPSIIGALIGFLISVCPLKISNFR